MSFHRFHRFHQSYLVAAGLLLIMLTATVPTSAEYPIRMKYYYRYFNYWCGSASIHADFYDNKLVADYIVDKRGNGCDAFPFPDSFSTTIDNAYQNYTDLFDVGVNTTNIRYWSSEIYYENNSATCDAGGYNSTLYMEFPAVSNFQPVVVSDIIDNDSCLGTRTRQNDLNILPEIQFVHHIVMKLLTFSTNASSTPTSSSLPVDSVMVFAGFVVLVVSSYRKSKNRY